MLGGECVQGPGGEDPSTGGALGGMEEFAEKTVELPDWDDLGGEELDAEVPGFFHLEGVNCHGDPDGVEDHANSGDDGCGALALV